MAVIKLKPACKDYLWGGDRLKKDFGKDFPGYVLAETWELSAHPDGPSIVASGPLKGKTLSEYIAEKGKGILGKNCERFEDFPILIKFIDAHQNLSVQVHPDDEYAIKNEHQYGKTECWYIVDALPTAGIYYGMKETLTKEQFREKIQDNTLVKALKFQPVHKGEMYFIGAGTLHAIGAGCLIAEIQQNSNVTYRVYDFGRVAPDGKPRELHIDKAIEVANLSADPVKYDFGTHLADCDNFTVDDLKLDGEQFITVGPDSFMSILVTDGDGRIKIGDERMVFSKGDSIFAEAGTGEISVKGKAHALLSTIRA